jgi:GcrA cell cycle regulator
MAEVQSHWETVKGLTDRLVTLHTAKQHSTRELANALSEEFHVAISRNAVIGKLRRMGLTQDPKLKTKRPPKKRKAKTQPAPKVNLPSPKRSGIVSPPSFPKPPPGPVLGLSIALHELKRSMCRYPSGHAPPYSFCGLKIEPGCAYCPAHCRLSRPPPQQQKARRR